MNTEPTVSADITPANNSVVTTEVTSIAQEDAKTGIRTELPSPEQLVSKAVVSMHRSRQSLLQLVGGMSKKATMRVLGAIFELPQDKLSVTLRGDEEKLAFALGQRIQSDRFLIIQHHINKELENRKRLELEKQAKPTEEVPNEQQQ